MPLRASSSAQDHPAQSGPPDTALITALQEGHALIVPDRHRAAALRLQWARLQQQAGRQVWATPPVHTWDAWLARQWREAVQRGDAPPQQLLTASQERALWEEALAAMAAPRDDPSWLTAHAASLMNAAARATQAGLDLRASAHSAEERLLADALAAVRALCTARGLLSLRIAPAAALQFLSQAAAPRIAGQPRLTPLQETLRRQHWPEATLLLPVPSADRAQPRRLRTGDLPQELEACAAWCRRRVEEDPEARLLVLSACSTPSLQIQADMLWQCLAPEGAGDEALRRRWLSVEGGQPLLHQALVADAFTALELASAEQELQTESVLALLRSPYFHFADAAQTAALGAWLARPGLAVFRRGDLQALLREAAPVMPGAGALLALLQSLQPGQPDLPAKQADVQSARPRNTGASATEWATRFAGALDAAGFARGQPLDSREHQRLMRWHELLDEFSALDAVLPPMQGGSALRRLRLLAAQARHQEASADAAVTLSGALGDPVASYAGIWVLGLTESRWPAPPRPDPWIDAGEQRRVQWPEAGVTQRRQQAQWARGCWQARTTELVLSHPEREEDLVHRPSAVAGPDAAWEQVETPSPPAATAPAARAQDDQLAPVDAALLQEPLRGGAALLAMQQECPFRAQAQFRLRAEPPPVFSDGIPAWMRGRLLHALLQALWTRLRDQHALLALDAAQERALLENCWTQAVAATRGARWLPFTVIARERERALRLAGKVLALERQRAPFRILHLEQSMQWRGADARLELRIDRVDAVEAGAVLIDYKSGAAARSDLHRQSLDPLQLALYAVTLAQHDAPPVAAALLNLDPADPHFSGAGGEGLLPGIHAVENWNALQGDWQQALLALVGEHLSGDATLTRDGRICARCHLPALCRRAGPAEEAAGG